MTHGQVAFDEELLVIRVEDRLVDVLASEALDRIQIPQEALDRIAPLVTPGASLIVSDLGMSGETGKDTDFIILAR